MSVVMAWNWTIVYQWLKYYYRATPKTDLLKVILYLGYTSCVAITVSSCCITSADDMPWTMHIIAATSFFIFALTAQGITTYLCYQIYYHQMNDEPSRDQFMSLNSLYAKIFVSGGSVVILLVNVLAGVLKWNGDISKICEWTGTLLIVIYNLSFAFDWYNKINTNITLKPSEDYEPLITQHGEQV
jgi:hypothetical protein